MKTNLQRWWDIPAALFLVGALFTAALRLQATNWTNHLGRVEIVVVIGAILGLALGKSIFSGKVTFLFGLVYSLFFVPWQLGLLMPDMDWGARINILYARLWYAIADFLRNQPVKDPILFLTTMVILYWFASLLSTYRLVRRANPWLPLLSLGGMILVIEYTMEMYRYSKIAGTTYSFLFLLFCLLLMGRLYFLRSRKDWEQRGGTVEMEVGYDLGRGVAVAAVVVALLAWNTPQLINLFDSNNPARERVSADFQAFRDRVSKAVNSLRSPGTVAVQGYGSNMFLGTGGNQSDEVVFTVKPENGQQPVRMYWSARTYDDYQNGQWESTISGTQSIGPSAVPLVYPTWIMRHDIQFTFTSKIPLLKTLYYVSEPLNVNRSAEAVVSRNKDGAIDLNTLVTDPPIKSGESYAVRARMAEPTIVSLQESGTDYPDFVKQRYLELPSNFSPRVIELAKQIAGEEKTPYDKTMAITQYLRRTITYTETVPEPPRNREPIEWFLFDLRAGFCNYYASAEVTMLRSLGVPARLVVGYAQGVWDPEQDLYTVKGKDSHAWPEVYFPKIGWVTFEPTVSQPLTSYPEGQQADTTTSSGPSAPIQQPTPDYAARGAEERANQLLNPADNRGSQLLASLRSIPAAVIILILLAIVVITLVLLELRRRQTQDLPLPSWLEKMLDERGFRTPEWLRMWSRRALRTPMENLFASVSFMLRVWGQKVEPALTPAEQVALLVNVVPTVGPQALTLLEEYQRAMYSPYPADLFRARQAVTEIRSKGYRTWVMRLIGLES